jgi:hypothetical protein
MGTLRKVISLVVDLIEGKKKVMVALECGLAGGTASLETPPPLAEP